MNQSFKSALGAGLLLLVASGGMAGTVLVSGNFRTETDSLGFRWDFNSYGAVEYGTNNIFSGAGRFEVDNNSSLNNQNVKMTQDGSEFYLSGMAGRNYQIPFTRRVRLDKKQGAVRFIDTFRNPTASPITVALEIQNRMNSQASAVSSSSGTPNPVALGPKDCGIIAAGYQGSNTPFALFYFGSASGKVKPTLQLQGNYQFNATYSFSVPAGGEVSIMHGLAQRGLTTMPDAKELKKLFRVFEGPGFVSDLDSKEQKSIANGGPVRFSVSEGGSGFDEAFARLDLTAEKSDVVAAGPTTRLGGTATCRKLAVKTRFGQAEIPFEKVAGMSGPRSVGGVQVFLTDGQVLTGEVTAEELKFALPSGAVIDLEFSSLDRLARLSGKSVDRQGFTNWVETFDGNRIAVTLDSKTELPVGTAWGGRRIPFDEIKWFSPAGEDALGWMVGLKDGSQFYAMLGGEPLELNTKLFGKQRLDPGEIKSCSATASVDAAKTNGDEEVEVVQATMPTFTIAGGQVLVGNLEIERLQFESGGQIIPFPATQIRHMANTVEDQKDNWAAQFDAHTWDGSVVTGRLKDQTLPLRVGDVVWQLPTADILEAALPMPPVSDGVRDKIATAIRSLGDPNWEVRETASREISQFGEMARAQLKEAMQQSSDPEVKHRAELLINQIE